MWWQADAPTKDKLKLKDTRGTQTENKAQRCYQNKTGSTKSQTQSGRFAGQADRKQNN